jgi:hypothetical protein
LSKRDIVRRRDGPVAALKQVYAGDAYFSPRLVGMVLDAFRHREVDRGTDEERHTGHEERTPGLVPVLLAGVARRPDEQDREGEASTGSGGSAMQKS